MVSRRAPRCIVWLALSAALACGRRGAPAAARAELAVATPSYPDSPDAGSGLGLHPVNANVYETLVRLTPDFSVAPQLATRWQLRSRNTWRFHLRQGVRMHDGTTLTAAAVVWTMRRIARAGGGPMGIGEGSVRVIDDTTLDITPTRPARRLVEQLANPDWSIMAPGPDSAPRPVGTGPFRFVEYARGDHLTVERFDEYWGDRARLRLLTFRFLPDANARLLALRAAPGAARARRRRLDAAAGRDPRQGGAAPRPDAGDRAPRLRHPSGDGHGRPGPTARGGDRSADRAAARERRLPGADQVGSGRSLDGGGRAEPRRFPPRRRTCGARRGAALP